MNSRFFNYELSLSIQYLSKDTVRKLELKMLPMKRDKHRGTVFKDQNRIFDIK